MNDIVEYQHLLLCLLAQPDVVRRAEDIGAGTVTILCWPLLLLSRDAPKHTPFAAALGREPLQVLADAALR